MIVWLVLPAVNQLIDNGGVRRVSDIASERESEMRQRIAIVGVGESDFGEVPDKNVLHNVTLPKFRPA